MLYMWYEKLYFLNSLQEIKLAMAKEGNTDEAFAKQIEDIENFTLKVDQMLTKFVESDEICTANVC